MSSKRVSTALVISYMIQVICIILKLFCQFVWNNTAKSADHVKYLQHYTLWKKEVPEDEEELRKFRTALLNLDVSMRLYKEA